MAARDVGEPNRDFFRPPRIRSKMTLVSVDPQIETGGRFVRPLAARLADRRRVACAAAQHDAEPDGSASTHRAASK
jgi:hypothetical protein